MTSLKSIIVAKVTKNYLINRLLSKQNVFLQILNGNDERNNIIKHNLVGVTRARFIRFQPTEFHNRKAMRVEVYGVLKPAGN